MVSRITILAAYIVINFLENACCKDYLRVCYFPSWTNVRESPQARYDIKDVDPTLCSHLVYAFGRVDRENKVLAPVDSWLEDDRPGYVGRYREFNNLKKINGYLWTLLSVGGQTDYGEGFIAVTESDEVLSRFAKSTVSFLRKRDFDGLDIDWEYPNKANRDKLTNLLKELRKEFDDEKANEKLILSLAGAAGQWYIDEGYDIPNISNYVDYVNLMTYDYAVKTSVVTAFSSPLYSRENIQFNPTLSVNWTVHYWRSQGLPSSKMVVGITGVGRRLVLANTSMTGVGSPVTGQVRLGNLYRLEAGLAYPEVCLMLADTVTKKMYDEQQKGPYLVRGDDWVGYEDKESISLKCFSRWVEQNANAALQYIGGEWDSMVKWVQLQGLGGVMFWSLDQDDFTGQMCGNGKYPLLKAINDGIVTKGLGGVSPRTTTFRNSASLHTGWVSVTYKVSISMVIFIINML